MVSGTPGSEQQVEGAPDGRAPELRIRKGSQRAIDRMPSAARRSDLEAAITELEHAMFARRATAGEEPARTFELCFDDDAPHGLLELLNGEWQLVVAEARGGPPEA